MEFSITSKDGLVSKMRAQITRDATQAARALLAIYRNQTMTEQRDRATRHRNGIGFTPIDAEFLTGIACWVKAGHALTPRQFEAVRDRIGKYAGQLVTQSLQRGTIVKQGRVYLWGAQLNANKAAGTALKESRP